MQRAAQQLKGGLVGFALYLMISALRPHSSSSSYTHDFLKADIAYDISSEIRATNHAR